MCGSRKMIIENIIGKSKRVGFGLGAREVRDALTQVVTYRGIGRDYLKCKLMN